VRYGQQMLKAKPGFFAQLVPVVVATFRDAFPELVAKQAFVEEVVRDEEDSFTRTLANGIRAFNKAAERVRAAGGGALPGADAFHLYDSMGFPFDLTLLMAAEQGLSVDAEGFAAGELKHGPIALIEEGQPVIVIVPSPRDADSLHPKVISNIQEIRARGAKVIAIAEEGEN
jgi:alanyl-tRNA synthetase